MQNTIDGLAPGEMMSFEFAVSNDTSEQVMATVSLTNIVSPAQELPKYVLATITEHLAEPTLVVGPLTLQELQQRGVLPLSGLQPHQTKPYLVRVALAPDTPESLQDKTLHFTLTSNIVGETPIHSPQTNISPSPTPITSPSPSASSMALATVQQTPSPSPSEPQILGINQNKLEEIIVPLRTAISPQHRIITIFMVTQFILFLTLYILILRRTSQLTKNPL